MKGIKLSFLDEQTSNHETFTQTADAYHSSSSSL